MRGKGEQKWTKKSKEAGSSTEMESTSFKCYQSHSELYTFFSLIKIHFHIDK